MEVAYHKGLPQFIDLFIEFNSYHPVGLLSPLYTPFGISSFGFAAHCKLLLSLMCRREEVESVTSETSEDKRWCYICFHCLNSLRRYWVSTVMLQYEAPPGKGGWKSETCPKNFQQYMNLLFY